MRTKPRSLGLFAHKHVANRRTVQRLKPGWHNVCCASDIQVVPRKLPTIIRYSTVWSEIQWEQSCAETDIKTQENVAMFPYIISWQVIIYKMRQLFICLVLLRLVHYCM